MKFLPFTEHTQFIFKSILAGILIALAAGTFLGCTQLTTLSENLVLAKVVGSFLFSFGLIGVIILKANLYTGKVGYVDSKKKAIRAFWMLVINLGIAFLIGFLYRGLNGFVDTGTFGPESARALRPWYQNLFYGFSCGVMVHLAIELHRRTRSFLPVILCVMSFILSGTEHSIACAFFLGASQLSWLGFGQLMLIVAGNTIGAVAINWLLRGAEFLNELPDNIQR